MSKYFMLQDQQKCIGCHACEIQCKSNKSLPPEPRLCQVITVGPSAHRRCAAGLLCIHALFSLRESLVCGGLPHRRDAAP
jgi:Fe-S-cluster-containing dehydrogenase component